MFLRFTSRTNADGSVARYVALAHNRRVNGKIKPDVLMNLGRVEQVDVDGLRRLAASINKHLGDVDELGDGARAQGVQLLGRGGVLQQLTRRFLEAALEAEMDAHLGYDCEDGRVPPRVRV